MNQDLKLIKEIVNEWKFLEIINLA